MRWRDWQEKIDDAEVVIYYNQSSLYPISEWLHPGALPIGTGTKDDIRQDLPNLDWIIRHLLYLGFRKITVASHESFKGLDRFYRNFDDEVEIVFTTEHFSEILKSILSNDCKDVVLLSGLIPTNADLRHSLMLHRQRDNVASLLSIRGLQFRIGVAEVDDKDYITHFREKPIDRGLLINSNISIVDTKKLLYSGFDYKELIDLIDGHGYSIEQIATKTINHFAEKGMLSSVELTGMTRSPWFVDLSQLETWVKLDHDEFIEHFSHLVTK